MAAAGANVVPCRQGCSACCHGIFAITAADAESVREGVTRLPPAERVTVLSRARQVAAAQARAVPGWGPPWDLGALPLDALASLGAALSRRACPALDDDGACRIHAWRPAACRLMGLPMRAPDAGVQPNRCPIREDFPDYAALAPTPFDLARFLEARERHERLATRRGSVPTTVAGALALE